jgi:hypothetical protein
MFTIALAFIDAKYQMNFMALYGGTVLIDFCMWQALSNIFTK